MAYNGTEFTQLYVGSILSDFEAQKRCARPRVSFKGSRSGNTGLPAADITHLCPGPSQLDLVKIVCHLTTWF